MLSPVAEGYEITLTNARRCSEANKCAWARFQLRREKTTVDFVVLQMSHGRLKPWT